MRISKELRENGRSRCKVVPPVNTTWSLIAKPNAQTRQTPCATTRRSDELHDASRIVW